jgi:plasmid stabilization system protein ParE
MRVRLTDEAKAKLRAIRAQIAEDAPQRADAMIDRITRHAERIGELPHAGRRVPEYQIDTLREVLERPYRIIYRIQPDEIEVLTVMHYRQLLPGDLA